MRSFAPLIQQANAQQSQGNFKSLLQQYAQQNLNATPVYELLDEKGPDHNKCFEAAVIVAGRQFQSAWGVNKKEAEQKAAFNALVALGLIKDTAENRNF
jgi:ribonuclease-3